MTGSKLARAIAFAVDTAAVFAVVEAVVLLARCEALRSANGFATVLFSSMGLCVAVAALPALVASFIASEARWFRITSLACGAVASVFAVTRGGWSAPLFAIGAVVCFRAALAPSTQARFARNAAAVFSVAFALLALVSSHAVRSYGAARGLLLATAARAAVLHPAPIAPRPIDVARTAAGRWIVPQALFVSVRGLSADACGALIATRVVARNAAVLVDARASDADPLAPWANRFARPSEVDGVRFVRCARASTERFASTRQCALDALATTGPLALALDLDATASDSREIDGVISATLQRANQRHALARSIVAFTCGSRAPRSSDWISPNDTRAVVLLSSPMIRPTIARGAVVAEELASAIDAVAAGHPERSALAQLALHQRPWFDRTVRVQRERDGQTLDAVYTARYALHVQSTRWYVALFDLDLDPRAAVNRADILPALTRSLLATP